MNEPKETKPEPQTAIEALNYELCCYEGGIDRFHALVGELNGKTPETEAPANPAPGCFRLALEQAPDRLKQCNESLNVLMEKMRQLCLG